ncbi:hypothetical protein PENANT_c110G09420 [Penicillium antarcticum]|uniref:Uncharacterized protein n=2 Tax=Penicillium antarcticum TaxID=416450 RepID=A0A1V6PK50_9EURO|nr:hypothetical protein PENANT_c110G09420 [Penicillium antarcticum]
MVEQGKRLLTGSYTAARAKSTRLDNRFAPILREENDRFNLHPAMQISPTVHTALATVLLVVSLVRFELSRRAVWGNTSSLALDLAVSVPKDVLLAAYMGLNWAATSEDDTVLFLGSNIDHQAPVSPNEHPAAKPPQYTIPFDDLFYTVFRFLMLDQDYSHNSWYLCLPPTARSRALSPLLGLSELGFSFMVAAWVYNDPFPDSITTTLCFALHNRVGSCASSDCGLRSCPGLLVAVSGGNDGRLNISGPQLFVFFFELLSIRMFGNTRLPQTPNVGHQTCSPKRKLGIFFFNLLQDVKYGSEGLYSQCLLLYVVVLGLAGQRGSVCPYLILTGSGVAVPEIRGSSIELGCVDCGASPCVSVILGVLLGLSMADSGFSVMGPVFLYTVTLLTPL